jgi:sugar phosphate isomerase/epimerase
MQRREFLWGSAAAGAAALIGVRGRTVQAQGRGGRAANVGADKLARIAIMTYNFQSMIQLPWQDRSPERTLDLFDIPQMYVDIYGVHNIEFQHAHLAQAEESPSFIAEIKSRVAAVKSRISQINLEFGPQNISATDPALRQQALDRTRKWIDIAAALECPRVMINQGPLTEETKTHAIETFKAMSDYGKSRKVMVSAETRGTPPEPVWPLLKEVIEAAGAYSNVDIGNVGARNQTQLHECIAALHPTSSGNMHIKSTPYWDIGAAVRYMNDTLGYRGLYSIEVSQHPAIRIVYNTILANI